MLVVGQALGLRAASQAARVPPLLRSQPYTRHLYSNILRSSHRTSHPLQNCRLLFSRTTEEEKLLSHSWRITTALAFILVSPTLAAAPLTIDLPAQTGNFVGSVRGYWFTAPVDFDIVGLFVPTDASSGLQTIEVLRLNANPPACSATSNDFTSLYRVVDDSSLTYIPVNIPIHVGDIVGILSYRGNVNSYGSSPYVTSIFGNPVTLNRFGMQYSLVTAPAHDVWTEAGGSISRVSFQYDNPAAARFLSPPPLR